MVPLASLRLRSRRHRPAVYLDGRFPPSRTLTHADRDPRWPEVRRALDALRAEHRGSVRIVDADCGGGELLLRAVSYARTIGFVAIEGRGIDGSPHLIARARSNATALHDPAIGLDYQVRDVAQALAEEAELPADIVLWSGTAPPIHAIARALATAGRCIVGAVAERHPQ